MNESPIVVSPETLAYKFHALARAVIMSLQTLAANESRYTHKTHTMHTECTHNAHRMHTECCTLFIPRESARAIIMSLETLA